MYRLSDILIYSVSIKQQPTVQHSADYVVSIYRTSNVTIMESFAYLLIYNITNGDTLLCHTPCDTVDLVS